MGTGQKRKYASANESRARGSPRRSNCILVFLTGLRVVPRTQPPHDRLYMRLCAIHVREIRVGLIINQRQVCPRQHDRIDWPLVSDSRQNRPPFGPTLDGLHISLVNSFQHPDSLDIALVDQLAHLVDEIAAQDLNFFNKTSGAQ